MRRGTGARLVLLVALAVLATGTAGCGSDGPQAAGGNASASSTASTTAPPSHAHTEAGDDEGERPTIVDFRGAERQELADQLVRVRELAMRYPTVADAEAAGYELTTPYAPGTGAHYGRDADTQAPGRPLDLAKAQSFLYDGTDPDSRLVGVMYVQLGGDEPPDGFAGPLDTWEAFPGQCLQPGTTDPVFPTKDSVTKAECDEADGTFVDVTAWIQHVWVVPGWEAPGGVFAPSNADIVCADGTTDADDVEGCPAPS